MEDDWLASADNGGAYFIGKNYTDAEKQTLFAKRGDKNLYRWQSGMWKPELLAS